MLPFVDGKYVEYDDETMVTNIFYLKLLIGQQFKVML